MPKKDDLPNNKSILALSGLNAKAITGVSAYFLGSTAVIELSYSGGTSYVKVRGLQIEVGGTNEWGTGTV